MEEPIIILLAEDNENDKQMVVENFKKTSIPCDIKWVRDGQEVSDYLHNQKAYDDRRKYPRPHIILLDIKMPGKDGFAVFEELMSHDDLRNIPVIFLTSLTDQETAVNLMKAGATDYIAKQGLSPEILARSIRYGFELRKKEQQRLTAEQLSLRLGRVLDNSTNEFYMFSADTHRLIQVNRGLRRNLGYAMDELLQMKPIEFMPDISEEQFSEYIRPLLTGEQAEMIFETFQKRKNGTRYPVEVRFQLSRVEKPPIYVAVVQDTTERKHAEETIEHLHYYDAITELPNRFLFRDRVAHVMADASRTHQIPVVFCVNLDHFKTVIETFGHESGDRILKSVGIRLKEVLREGDTVACSGGDEFLILAPGTGASVDVAKIAQRILSSFGRPFSLDGHDLHLTASIGASIFPMDGEDPDALIKNADIAMFRAKEDGRNNFQLFNSEMHVRGYGRLTLESSLRRAVEKNEFLLHYQPEIDLASGEFTGTEALIRWQHPQRGLIYPKEFIGVSEESGLIIPIGEWVLKEACVQNQKWQTMYSKGLTVSVNISPAQIRSKGFVDHIIRIVKETGMDPKYLFLELTENIFMDPSALVMDAINKLRKLKIKFAIDDFGSGYCSLGYLKSFAVDTLKIDQSFIRTMTTDTDYASIVRSVIELAHRLKLKVTAEGVETEEQHQFLLKHMCDHAQGFLFSTPLPANELTSFLLKKRNSLK